MKAYIMGNYTEKAFQGFLKDPTSDRKAAVEQLTNKLKTLGLDVKLPAMEGATGKVVGEISQFGGRFGKDLDGTDINDDGISHKKEGGLKLEVKFEKLENGSSKVFAKLV